ncbi:MAG: hypothetical protein AAF492_01450 [Verrucomicrobiota bacterium]
MPVNVHIPWRYRSALFLLIAVSWITGILYFVLKQWFDVEDEFGMSPHPWLPTLLKIHAAAAFLGMIAYGFMLGTHVPAGWRLKRLRKLGLTLVIAQGLLILSGYLLYYMANYRDIIAYVHAGVGLLFPMLLGAHIWAGVRERGKMIQA